MYSLPNTLRKGLHQALHLRGLLELDDQLDAVHVPNLQLEAIRSGRLRVRLFDAVGGGCGVGRVDRKIVDIRTCLFNWEGTGATSDMVRDLDVDDVAILDVERVGCVGTVELVSLAISVFVLNLACTVKD